MLVVVNDLLDRGISIKSLDGRTDTTSMPPELVKLIVGIWATPVRSSSSTCVGVARKAKLLLKPWSEVRTSVLTPINRRQPWLKCVDVVMDMEPSLLQWE